MICFSLVLSYSSQKQRTSCIIGWSDNELKEGLHDIRGKFWYIEIITARIYTKIIEYTVSISLSFRPKTLNWLNNSLNLLANLLTQYLIKKDSIMRAKYSLSNFMSVAERYIHVVWVHLQKVSHSAYLCMLLDDIGTSGPVVIVSICSWRRFLFW